MNKQVRKIKVLLVLLICMFPMLANAEVKKVSCGYKGSNFLKDVPAKIPSLSSFGYTLLEVAVPVIIIIFGMIDLVRAITAGKEDEMKKSVSLIVRRLVMGVLVFFVFIIVKLLVNVVNVNSNGIVDCMNCFVNNKCHNQVLSNKTKS